ncbi:MAG: adenosylcobalamin-dependent ribonucleoside-diphosphate reductase [Anaerolineae bacterium]|nr:adenosylcobalamin-dependent ribonucleoside-diphosphate reductase [Anaerolineae bacterium]
MHVAKVGLDLPGTNSLPTTPIPEDLKARPIHLTDNARTVLHKRYLRRGEDGQPCETEHEMFWRVAYHVALAETEFNGDVIEQARLYYDILTNLLFFPNSPTFTGAGTPLGQLAACFVIRIDDDMGRTESGIFQALRDAALIQQTGGGNGFAFSNLRPKGALVNSSRGEATGPVGFLRVYDQAFGEIAQGGCLTPDTLVFTDRGLLRLDEIVTHKTAGWQSHQLTVATDEGTRLSTQAYNNGVAPVLRVATHEGLQLTGTPNHKVKIMTADGPAWRRLDELQPGDSILVKLGQHQGQLQPLSRPIRQHGNQVMPTFPAVLDTEFAFFLGCMAGDGFVASSEQDHRIGVTVAHSSYLMDEMPALFRRIFGDHLTLHRQQKENDASITFSLDNRAVKDFLTINGLVKARSTVASVPRLIRQSPPEVVAAFLRGLLEADGSLSHGYPQLLNTSETLIHETAILLIGLGCPVDIRQLPHAEDHYGQAPVWSLRIHSFKGLLAWRERIGCDSRSRFMACYEFQPDLSRESSYPLPCPEYWVTPVLDAIRLPQIDQRGTGKNFRSTQPRLQKQLLRYTRGDRQLTLSGYAQLEAQYDEFAHHARPVDDRWFVTVKSVQDAGESLTLDIEVDDNHTYLANGLTTHNSRRGANMAVLKVSHPDIREFITCKTNESHITNFNISVGMTDEFMRAVEADEDFNLVNPQNGEVWETIRARELFDLIIKQAHHNGEPGVLFLDAANRQNPVPHLYELESTNPCGEQFLGPFENCCLGSINLANLVTTDGKVDWRRLKKLTEITTRFLDDVVSANNYVPSVPQLAQAAHRVRRIGLGIMGLGDLMYKLGVRYGSEEGQEFAGQIMEFVRFHCMRTSILLARDRGAFPAIRGSIYDPDNLKWQPPTPLFPYTRDWDRPALDWSKIVAGIKKHGIRNGAQMTVAPTGTIATVSGCEAYGCEPVFALAYIRHVNDKGRDLQLQYTSPLFEKALQNAGLSEAEIKAIVEEVNVKGSCQDVDGVPEQVRHTFVVSSDVSTDEHIRMQAAMQRFVDNAISKTINMPADATVKDVEDAYMLGWKLGCKGLTVYVTGSREKVVLETHATAQAKQEKQDMPENQEKAIAHAPAAAVAMADLREEYVTPLPLFPEFKKPRPRRLEGRTYRVGTPVGRTYVTINANGEGADQPFELFIHTSKAGSELAAISEAIGRLISLVLRVHSPITPRERLKEIVRQLEGIGGGHSTGFGAERVRSLPDGVAQALQEYLDETSELADEEPRARLTAPTGQMQLPTLKAIGDLCPECGEATLINEEGCRKCHTCGYSEC